MRLRPLAVVLALACVLVGCGDRAETARVTRDAQPAAPVAAAESAQAGVAKAAPPFDVQRVVERVRNSFRRTGSAIVGGRPTYSVSAADARVSIRPMTRDSGPSAHPRERARRRAQPVVGAALELETVAAGRRGAPLELGTTPDVDVAGELELAARGVVEHVASRDDGAEVSWSFPARPRGTGDLELRVRASGLEPAGETAGGLHFRDPATGLGLRVGAATWIDAKGLRIAVAERFDGTEITLVVAADVVERSSFPATLDPVIGPERGADTPVFGPASGSQDVPAVAYSGTSYLAAWTDERSALNDQIFATRINAAGAVLDPNGIAVSPLGQAGSVPTVTWDGTNFLVAYASDGLIHGRRVATSGALVDVAPFDIASAASGANADAPAAASNGATTLVVWGDYRSGAGSDIYGARVTGSTVLDPNGVAVSTATNDQYSPSVAFNGTNWLVVWQDYRTGSSGDVYGARVSTAGAVLDSVSTGIAISAGATADELSPRVASNGSAYLVVWQDSRNVATTSTDIYGARVSTAGAVLDASGIQVSNAATDQFYAVVAFDGTNYMVVWQDGGGGIYGNRVAPATGALLNGAAGAALAGAPVSFFYSGLGVFSAGAATYVSWTLLNAPTGRGSRPRSHCSIRPGPCSRARRTARRRRTSRRAPRGSGSPSGTTTATTWMRSTVRASTRAGTHSIPRGSCSRPPVTTRASPRWLGTARTISSSGATEATRCAARA
jgi:hypothetical protein